MKSKYMIKKLNALKLIKEYLTDKFQLYTVIDTNKQKLSLEHLNSVFFNQKINSYSCTCWHYANRTAPNIKKWGNCSHIKKVIQEMEK